MIAIEESDLSKILDNIKSIETFLKRRDEMNAELHLAREVIYSALTVSTTSTRERIERLLSKATLVPPVYKET